jgi:ABC-type lipoprotein release transport system permease subunit
VRSALSLPCVPHDASVATRIRRELNSQAKGWGLRATYAIWRMLAGRTRANWRLVATLTLGVAIAAILLAAAPIYARAMADLGITFAIRDRLETTPATQVILRDRELATDDGRRLQEAVAQRAEERIGWFAGPRERLVQGPKFAIENDRAAPIEKLPIAALWHVTSAAGNVRVLSGRLPAAQDSAEGPVLEFALAPAAAERAGLQVNDRITLIDRFDDCAREIPTPDRPPPPCDPTVGLRFTMPAQFVGIVEPADPDSAFWVSGVASLFDPYYQGPDTGPVLPALTDEAGFNAVVGTRFPGYRANFTWHVFADASKLTRDNYQRAMDDMIALRDDLKAVNGFSFSTLEDTLRSFNRELSYQQGPLLIMLLQIAGIALFYVAVVALIVVERQAAEIALLRSRGAGVLQVLGMYALEGAMIGIPVILVAPLVATAATALLGRLSVFERVTGGDTLPVRLVPEAFLYATLGTVLSLLMLIGAAFLAARATGVTSRRQAARPSAPFFLRYYLDFAVVGLAALLMWELRERGTVFKPGSAGGLSTDPLLLLSPALLTLGAAALVLRFYPLGLRFASWLVGSIASVPVSLGLRQVVRNSGQYTRLALLLMMAVAVGTFAASYSSTAERSFRDRASFESGVDMRAALGNTDGLSDKELEPKLMEMAGVDRAMTALRQPIVLATPGENRLDQLLLGVDPDAVPDLLWFRDDLADDTLPELMTPLRGPAPRGRLLPGAPTTLSAWVNPAQMRENTTLYLRLRDERGTISTVELGKLDFMGWQRLTANLQGRFQPVLIGPIYLVSILASIPANLTVTNVAPLYIDDITVAGPEGETLVEDFESTVRWQVAPARQPLRGPTQSDEFRIVSDDKHGGASSGRITLRQGAISGPRGIYATELLTPIPVIVSPGFSAITGAGVGQQTMVQVNEVLMPVIVRGISRLFPTIDAGMPFVIANREHLTAWLSAFVDSSVPRVNEAWFRLRPDADREATIEALVASPYRLGNEVDRERVLASVNANPLIAAGGSGILLVASMGMFALIAAALLVTLVTSVQRRRTEFAVLRSMGVSRGQILRLLGFEYALVAIVGLSGGVILGRAVGRRMLSFLEVTSTGSEVVPPFILQTDWVVVISAVGIVVLTFVAGMLLSTRWVLRQINGQALRATE